MATETAAEKAAREAKEAEEKAKNTPPTSPDPASPPRGDTSATPSDKVEGMSEREKKASGSDTPDVLSMVLAQQTAPAPQEITYEQNRWKVGEGHGMLDRYVQGEEVDLQDLVSSLGKTRAEQAYHLDRLFRLGAVVRMSDQEPLGGIPTGSLNPLMTPSARKMDTSNAIRMALGPDMRERVAGLSSEDEMNAREARWQQGADRIR